jgi:FixJ family two-component response regulator
VLQKSPPEDGDSEIVCLVDDDPSVRKSVGRLLESEGFKVLAFNEPTQFLEHLAANRVPVLVLDIWMKSMTGLELLAHLCARSPRTRVIFITGHEDRAAETTVMQAGAFAFFLKPFNENEFLDAVHRALSDPVQGGKRNVTDRLVWSGLARSAAERRVGRKSDSQSRAGM